MKKFPFTLLCFFLLTIGIGHAQEGTPKDPGRENLKTRAATKAKEAAEAEARLPAMKQAVDKAQDAPAKTAAEKALEEATREVAEKKKAADAADTELKKAEAANPVALGNESIYKASLGALTMLFVLAVLLENALALIFHWPLFLTYFSARVWKSVIMFLGAWLIVTQLDIDVVASLVNVYKSADGTNASQIPSGTLSCVITALILAGGSAGVYNIMMALGFRTRREEEVGPRLDMNQAWLAIRVLGNEKKARVAVQIRAIGPTASPPRSDDPLPIAGTIGADRPRFWDLLFVRGNRFPSTGGHTVSANVIYEIAVIATIDGVETPWLHPTRYAFAPRAIVDLEVQAPGNAGGT